MIFFFTCAHIPIFFLTNLLDLYPVMANGIRTGDHRGFNKGRSSKFREGSRVRQTPEEGRGTYWLIRCGNSNKDEDNSPKNFNDKKFCTKENNNIKNNKLSKKKKENFGLVWFYGISTFVGYLTPNPFLCK